MITLADLAQPFLVGGFGSAVVLGLVRLGSEYIKHRRSSSESRLDDASTADTVSQTYERIFKDMRRALDTNQREVAALRIQVDALNARIDSNANAARKAHNRAEESEHRNGRNMRLLQQYAVKLCDIMRAAGLVPPDPPILEPEPSRYQLDDLHDAIPDLMHGGIASMGAKAPKD